MQPKSSSVRYNPSGSLFEFSLNNKIHSMALSLSEHQWKENKIIHLWSKVQQTTLQAADCVVLDMNFDDMVDLRHGEI